MMLIPDWNERGEPIKTRVKADQFWILTERHRLSLAWQTGGGTGR